MISNWSSMKSNISTFETILKPTLILNGILISDPMLTGGIGIPDSAPISASPTAGSRLQANEIVSVTPLAADVTSTVTNSW